MIMMLIVPDEVEVIKSFACECRVQLRKVLFGIIPHLRSINEKASLNCDSESLLFPSLLQMIGSWAFEKAI
jgi:hypothetical protein